MQRTRRADANALSSNQASCDSSSALSTLVILGASITALAVARDAYRHGLRPIVIDSDNGPAFHSRWVTSIDVNSLAAGARIERVLSAGGPHAALIATSDQWIHFLMEHRGVLSSTYKLIVQPDDATLDICLDKRKFSEWCAASGLPAPAAWSPGRGPRPAELRFPVLLRPLRTLHSRQSSLPKAAQARDESELAHWLKEYETRQAAALVSESLLGRPLEQYSIPFARRDEEILLFTARKVRPSAELCQTGTCVEMCVDERVEHLARSAIEQLGYFGIGEVEILRDTFTGKDYLIEINARPWLQYALAPASNHDFLALVLGLSAIDSEVAVRTGRTWIDLYQDLFVAFSRSIGVVRHGRLGLVSYLRSLFRCNVFALFDWRDPGPFLRTLRRQ